MPSTGKEPLLFAFFVVSIYTLSVNSTMANSQSRLFLVCNECLYHIIIENNRSQMSMVHHFSPKYNFLNVRMNMNIPPTLRV